MGWQRIIASALLLGLGLGAAGCGTESFSGGFGTLVLTSVTPSPIPGPIATPLTITGSDFSNEVGLEVEVTFIATSGTPFLGGTSARATVEGVITSSTTVDTISPLAVICGPASFSARVRVTMRSGVFGESAVPLVVFVAPVLTGFGGGGGTFPAAVPTPFTLLGANFPNPGSPCTIHWRTLPAGAGPAAFQAGSSQQVTTSGVVTSATAIDGVSPLALVCGPVSIPAEIFRVDFNEGSCTPTAGPFVPATFEAPTIAAVTNTSGRAPDTGTSQFAAAIPEPFSVTGAGFGPLGGTATVTFTSPGSAVFGNGLLSSASVQGTIVSPTLITVPASPEALLCNNPPGIVLQATTVGVTLPDGSCTPPAAPAAATFFAPTVAAIVNTSGNAPHGGLAEFAAAIPETFSLTGDRFGPVGGVALVTFASAFVPTPFEGGTAASTTVLAQIVSPTLITGVSPESALCGAATDAVLVSATLEGGSCSPVPTPATYFAPSVTGGAIANDDRGGATFLSAIPETFTLTGTDFGPVGGLATVRFTSTSLGTAATPFDGGTSAFVDVLATVTSRTTIVGTSPEALLCPDPTVDPQTGLVADVALGVTLEGGACTDPAAPLALAGLIEGPTIAAFASPADAAPGTPPVAVPSTLVLGAEEAPSFRLTGTGFAPLGATALITFEDTTVPLTAFDGGASVTVSAEVIGETVLEGTLPTITAPRLVADESVRVTVELVPNGSCAYFDALVLFVAPPTITTVTSTGANTGTGFLASGYGGADFLGCISSEMSLAGTGFLPTAGANTEVRIWSTADGFDLDALAPVRALGTGTPTTGTPALPVTDLEAAVITAVSITGNVRTDGLLPDLDADADGAVPYTVGVFNPDGQFDTRDAGEYRLQGPAVNLGASANVRNNNSVALDPSSFTDDFHAAAGSNDGVKGLNLLVASGDDASAGVGPVFNGTDVLISRSLDGGVTWTTAPAGLAAVDGFPAGASRNFGQVAYDGFGNAFLTYLVDDFVGGVSAVVVVLSFDQGASWTIGATLPTAAGNAGLFGPPSQAAGPDGLGGTHVLIGWPSSEGLVLGDSVLAFAGQMTGFGVGGLAAGPVPVHDGLILPLFGVTEVEVAVGPSGEDYVAWQEPQFLLPPFQQDIWFDADRDGLLGGTFGFGTDQFVASEDIPAFFLPSAPDTGPFVPSLSMAVIQAGVNSGRVVLAHDNVLPADFVTTFQDHAQVVARTTDDYGANWSGPHSVHAVDNADRFLPAIASDGVTGRLYVTWYDTTSSSAGAVNDTFERYGAASADGTAWGAARNLSGARGASAHVADFDTDFGLFAGVAAHGGCAVAAFSDLVDSTSADPVAVSYQQK